MKERENNESGAVVGEVGTEILKQREVGGGALYIYQELRDNVL